jgi:hypothetical protein
MMIVAQNVKRFITAVTAGVMIVAARIVGHVMLVILVKETNK